MTGNYLSPGVYVEQVPSGSRPLAGAGTTTAGFIGIVPDEITLPAPIKGNPGKFAKFTLNKTNQSTFADALDVKLVTNWSQYTSYFGDLIGSPQDKGATAEAAPVTIDNGYRNLAHAVFDYFNNGGTRCYVVRITSEGDVEKALSKLDPIDEIATIVIPGDTTQASQGSVITHCEKLHRFAVLDGAQHVDSFTKEKIQGKTTDSTNAAIYFPWIKIFDPSEKLMHPDGDGTIISPPSGGVAGVYANVDNTRGVYKAPANVIMQSVSDLQYHLTKADQDGLNPQGVNVIRPFNNNIKIYGARTMGGDANGDFKYVSTVRYYNFLRKSIDEGMQFVVFEPNSPKLWEIIKRTVGDFLLNQYNDGALFGETAKKAFYVKCDEETNPPSIRELGQVVTEIGVAIVKPAEFVVFRIQQMTGG